jgi:hypothetical protein
LLSAEAHECIFLDGTNIGKDCTFDEFKGGGDSQQEQRCFESWGEIRMLGAHIEGQLIFRASKLHSCASEFCLTASLARIDQGVFFINSENPLHLFRAQGAIRLVNADLRHQLQFVRSEVEKVDCTNMNLAGDMYWVGIQKTPSTRLFLVGASVTCLRDDQKSWPGCDKQAQLANKRTEVSEDHRHHHGPDPEDKSGSEEPEPFLKLAGFIYRELVEYKTIPIEDLHNNQKNTKPSPKQIQDYRKRIEWVRRQGEPLDSDPQPWIQLAQFMSSKGASTDAKYVIFEKQWLEISRMKVEPLKWVEDKKEKFVRLLLILLTCLKAPYKGPAFLLAWVEEAPRRIIYSVLLTLALGTFVYHYAWKATKDEKEATKALIQRHFDASGQVKPAIQFNRLHC